MGINYGPHYGINYGESAQINDSDLYNQLSMSNFKPQGYGSLNRPRRSRRGHPSFYSHQPRNNLISGTEEPPINVLRSQPVSKDLLQTNPQTNQTSPQTNQISPKSPRPKQEMPPGSESHGIGPSPAKIQDVKDIKGMPIADGSQLHQIPKSQMDIKLVNRNGKTLQLDPSALSLSICRSDEFMFVTENNQIVYPLVIHKFHHLSLIFFCDSGNCILVLLKHSLGYIYISHFTDHGLFFSYCQRNNWPMSTTEVPESFIKNKMIEVDNQRYSSIFKSHESPAPAAKESGSATTYKFKRTNLLGDSSVSPTDMYRDSKSSLNLSDALGTNGKPATYTRTRSGKLRSINGSNEYDSTVDNFLNNPSKPSPTNKNTSISSSPVEEQVVSLEPIPPYSPPLEYKFFDGKPFTIAYKDFKTLFNNDWVNDNIIDFFINYEIEQVISKGLFKESDIYTFNSFFYLKLISKKTQNSLEEIDYYGNIRRWLTKIDLFSFPNVILPINENLHWYACIIVGLPDFLSRARKEGRYLKEHENHENEKNGHRMSSRLNSRIKINYNESDDLHSDELMEIPDQKSSLKYPGKINIFVFDSLNQKHVAVHKPFRVFLMAYCRERYNIDIDSKDIVFRSTKVPKQNNFNDCGIHVIYNIRKFLNSNNECLRIWDKNDSNYKHFFKNSERSVVRKQLIDLLIDLHEEQERQSSKTSSNNKENINTGNTGNNNTSNDKSNDKINQALKHRHGDSSPLNGTLKSDKSDITSGQNGSHTSTTNNVVDSDSDDEVELLDFKMTNPVKVNSFVTKGRKPSRHLNVTISTSAPSSAGSDLFELSSQEQPRETVKDSNSLSPLGVEDESQKSQPDGEGEFPESRDKVETLIQKVPVMNLNEPQKNPESLLNKEDLDEMTELFGKIGQYGQCEHLKNKYLNRNNNISHGISKTSILVLNSLFPETRKAFTNEQMHEIMMFKKSMNHLPFSNRNYQLMDIYIKFRREFKKLANPNEPTFKINHAQGVVRPPEQATFTLRSIKKASDEDPSQSIIRPVEVVDPDDFKPKKLWEKENTEQQGSKQEGTQVGEIQIKQDNDEPKDYETVEESQEIPEVILSQDEDNHGNHIGDHNNGTHTPDKNRHEDKESTPLEHHRAISTSSLSDVEEDILTILSERNVMSSPVISNTPEQTKPPKKPRILKSIQRYNTNGLNSPEPETKRRRLSR